MEGCHARTCSNGIAPLLQNVEILSSNSLPFGPWVKTWPFKTSMTACRSFIIKPRSSKWDFSLNLGQVTYSMCCRFLTVEAPLSAASTTDIKSNSLRGITTVGCSRQDMDSRNSGMRAPLCSGFGCNFNGCSDLLSSDRVANGCAVPISS
jgi:hypothetical protein